MGSEINYTGSPPAYYAPFEVVLHNKPYDCWVSFLGLVRNITPLIERHEGEACIKPLLAFAGKDISDWFDEKTKDIKYHIHPVTGCRVPYTPHGRIPDVPVEVPAESWRPITLPWWEDGQYVIGKLTKRVRPIRIVNPAFSLETLLHVCKEDTILRIRERYSIFNSKCDEYIWRYFDRPLNNNLNLEDNGIPDERDHMTSIGIDPNFHIPAIFIYYCDHLKWVSDDSSSDTDDATWISHI